MQSSAAMRGKAAYAVYRAATAAAMPLIHLHLNWRRRRRLEHPTRWPERLGRPSSPRPPGPLIWFHAVSLGEGLAAIPMIRHCVKHRPELVVLFTTTTTSAFEVIKDRLPDGVIYQLAPIDSPSVMDMFLRYWKPIAVLLIESELWPNLIMSAAGKGIAVAVLNARMSSKSFERWSSSLALPLISLMLSKLSLIAPLSTVEAVRFQLLNASPTVIHFAGDLKFAAGEHGINEETCAKIKDLHLCLTGRPVWMAASIHQGEDEIMLWIHRELIKTYPNLVTILVTRQPEHGQQLALELKSQGINIALRSLNDVLSPTTSIYIVDTLGELKTLYRATPIAVIGGSFLPSLAGHNISEAAAAGCAVLTGPHLGHFASMLAEMLQSDSSSVLQVAGRMELLEMLGKLLGDKKSLDAHRKAANQAFSAISNGVLKCVWNLVNMFVLKEQIGGHSSM